MQVDVLVNNAGFGARGTVPELSGRVANGHRAGERGSLTRLTRCFPGMLARERGGILNVASTAAFQPGPLMGVYHATKAFVLSFTEGLAEELPLEGAHGTRLPGSWTDGDRVRRRRQHDEHEPVQTRPDDSGTVARAGYRGVRARQALVVPGFNNNLGIFRGAWLALARAARWSRCCNRDECHMPGD